MTPRNGQTRSSSARRGSMVPCICQPRCLKAAGMEMRPWTNGGGPALTALLGNNAQVLVSSWPPPMPTSRPARRAHSPVFGQARATLPEVPTLKELGFRRGVLPLGRPVCPQGHARGDHRQAARSVQEAAATEQFAKAIDNIGDVLAYQDQPEFAKFWDEDAKRVEDAARRSAKFRATAWQAKRRGRRMQVRRDHVAGGAFIVGGALILAVSGDLPFGTLASPGAGMLPKLVIGLMMAFGLIVLLRAGDSPPFAAVAWGDLPHGAARHCPGRCRRRALCAAGLRGDHVAAAVWPHLTRSSASRSSIRPASASARRFWPICCSARSSSRRCRAASGTRPPWKPPSTAWRSASRWPCGPTCCFMPSSAAWSARWSACCRASARSPASPSCCPSPSVSTPPRPSSCWPASTTAPSTAARPPRS